MHWKAWADVSSAAVTGRGGSLTCSRRLRFTVESKPGRLEGWRRRYLNSTRHPTQRGETRRCRGLWEWTGAIDGVQGDQLVHLHELREHGCVGAAVRLKYSRRRHSGVLKRLR